MRKLIVLFMMLITAAVFTACGEDVKPKTATYTVNADIESPTFYMNTETCTWNSSRGLVYSYQIGGDLTIEGSKITAGNGSEYIEFETLSESEVKAVKISDGFFGDMDPWIKVGDVFAPFADKETGDSKN